MSVDDPLAEVFGFKTSAESDDAKRFRKHTLCPFNNGVPDCTKDKANNPLGTCSINRNGDQIITCPVRFRENWLIAEHAADFFFDEGTRWTSMLEVKLTDKEGSGAGKIDLVSVAYDDQGKVQDFGALEVQAVYISGNVRDPFERYMNDPQGWSDVNWGEEGNSSPRADWYSSEKRLVTQLRRKGSILSQWNRKQAVALQSAFYDTIPDLPEVPEEEADMAWFIYDLADTSSEQYSLNLDRTIYTRYEPTLKAIATTEAGDMNDFVEKLQNRLDEKISSDDEEESYPPEAPTLRDLL